MTSFSVGFRALSRLRHVAAVFRSTAAASMIESCRRSISGGGFEEAGEVLQPGVPGGSGENPVAPGTPGGRTQHAAKTVQAEHVADASAAIETREGWLLVVQHGRLPDVAAARALQQRVEQACDAQGSRRVLFDNRDTEPPDDEVRDAMFEWAVNELERVALLLRSDLKRVRANMDALSRRGRVRAFVDEREATAWLIA
jgi:hypothetical protein